MDLPPKALSPSRVFDPSSARAALEAAGKKLNDAATAWGIRPSDPDTILIGAHLDAQKVVSDLVIGAAEHIAELIHELECKISNARLLAEGDLARQRVITYENTQGFSKLTTLLTEAVSKVKIQQEGLADQMVKKVFPDAVRALSGALVIHEQRVSRSIEWGRHFTLAAIAVGLVFGGYVWGTWADWGMATRLEDFRFAIDRCAFSTPALTIPGVGKVCRLDSMVRTGDLALEQ